MICKKCDYYIIVGECTLCGNDLQYEDIYQFIRLTNDRTNIHENDIIYDKLIICQNVVNDIMEIYTPRNFSCPFHTEI